ncbi:MAG: hypothetical protein ACI8V8_001931 [Chitinophagales bacterium]|jgi:hypothetical protein
MISLFTKDNSIWIKAFSRLKSLYLIGAMNAKPLFILFMLCLGFQVVAQTNTQLIFGQIFDSESREPLIGATVWIKDSKPLIGASAGLDGKYQLAKVPVGRVSLGVSYIGYEDLTIPEVLIGSGKAVNVDIKLQESLRSIEEIVVLGKKENSSMLKVDNEMATVSAMSFSLDQSSRYAGSNNDPSRLVLSFPGVRNQGDIQNGISIRGNSPTALLWTIEGLEVQSPNHFAREGSLGAVNMMSSNVMKSVDFFTAAFPAQYANAGSGVFDISYRNGNPEKYEASLAFGTLGLEGSVEGPFSKKYKGSFLLSYRYSTLGILSKLGYSIGGNTGPVYQDLNYKINLPTKKLGKFQFFGLVGDSYIRPIEIQQNYGGDWSDEYRLSMLGMKHSKRLNDKTFLQSKVLYSQSRGSYSSLWENQRFNSNQLTGEREYKGVSYINENFPIIEKRAQLDLKTSTKHSARHSYQTGINVTFIDFSQSFKRQQDVFKFNSKRGELVYKRSEIDSSTADIQTVQIKAFFQHKYRINEALSFTAGMSFLHMNANKFFALEPRVGMEFFYGNQHSFTMGFGMHSRLESIGFYRTSSTYLSANSTILEEPIYEESFGAVNQNVQATRSLHGVIGNSFHIAPDLTFKMEAYLQYLYNIPVEEFPTYARAYAALNYQYPSIFNYSFTQQAKYVNQGRGLNYGVDLSLEKSFSKKYYFLVNASYYQSKFRTPYSPVIFQKKWLNTRYNGNFILTLTGGKDFTIGKKKNNMFSMNFRSIWAGNNRIDDDITLEPFAKRLSNYFRIDTRFAYTRNKTKYSWTLSLDLQNMTNRINESSNPAINSVGMVPFLNYKVEL